MVQSASLKIALIHWLARLLIYQMLTKLLNFN
jgi:hypothetical protein